MATSIEIRVVEMDDPPAFPELEGSVIVPGSIDRVAVLRRGTEGGSPSVSLLITLPDGTIVFAQTTAALFEMMAGVLKGARQRWGE